MYTAGECSCFVVAPKVCWEGGIVFSNVCLWLCLLVKMITHEPLECIEKSQNFHGIILRSKEWSSSQMAKYNKKTEKIIILVTHGTLRTETRTSVHMASVTMSFSLFFIFILLLIIFCSYHRLNGSSSPILTATCLS